jgi:hypothetical protein
MKLSPKVRMAVACLLLLSPILDAQSATSIGLRIQKTPNLYFENGLSVNFSNEDWWSNRIQLAASYTTSRLGSAMGSNALKQDNMICSGFLQFRNNKVVMPVLGLNLGYFQVDTETEIFSDLPNSSLLLSAELGLGFTLSEMASLRTTVGYNIITGDGVDGPGTLYPIFLNFTAFYHLNGSDK